LLNITQVALENENSVREVIISSQLCKPK